MRVEEAIDRVKVLLDNKSVKKYAIFVIFMFVTASIIYVSMKTNILTTKYQIIITFTLGLIASFFANFFYNIICIVTVPSNEGDFFSDQKDPAIPDKYKKFLDFESKLKESRKYEILKSLVIHMPKLVSKRKKHLDKIRMNQKKERGSILKTPAWFSLSTTSSEAKYRLTLGFKNKGCRYWRSNPNYIGCLHCGYSSSAILNEHLIKKISKKILLTQFYHALHWANNKNIKFDVIEFLNDGSFFNYKDEYPESFSSVLFKELKKLEYIKRVLVESRPEYITIEKIDGLLNNLRDDQELEIGLGLETSDDFIRQVCINKGYSIKQFEEAVKIISQTEKRCSIVVYIVIKPAFITDKEAIEDAVETIKYLSELSAEYSVEIISKLEPAVIAAGTILEILHFDISHNQNEWYNLLSYWSIVEIISRSHKMGLSSKIRVGAREDMNVIEKVPAIYNHDDGTFNQYDFWVYDAIQKFNSDKNFIRLLADIQVVIVNDNESFNYWKRRVEIDQPCLLEYLKSEKEAVEEVRKQEYQVRREQFLHKVFEALDKIEIQSGSHGFARKLKKEKKQRLVKKKIQDYINQKFELTMSGLYKAEVIMFYFEKDRRQMLRVYFQLSNLEIGSSHDIWVGIPTIRE
ncbi:MAG: hypothetical protein KAH86_02850 [Methanosarcinales archaeon]|nr:hypothetical protein [Methanosarcinales archaeon]